MGNNGLPARRGNVPARPNPRPRAFWETPEQRKVRELENAAANRKYQAELDAIVDETKREIQTETTEQVLNNASRLADHAQRMATDELKARMMTRILEGWTDAQVNNLRNG